MAYTDMPGREKMISMMRVRRRLGKVLGLGISWGAQESGRLLYSIYPIALLTT